MEKGWQPPKSRHQISLTRSHSDVEGGCRVVYVQVLTPSLDQTLQRILDIAVGHAVVLSSPFLPVSANKRNPYIDLSDLWSFHIMAMKRISDGGAL
jgi:hypothetical protein